MRTKKKIPFNDLVKPISIATGSPENVFNCQLSGFGVLGQKLQYIDLEFVPDHICQGWLGKHKECENYRDRYHPESQLCAYNARQSPRIGDYGAPFVCESEGEQKLHGLFKKLAAKAADVSDYFIP